jgi:hypothetical protein
VLPVSVVKSQGNNVTTYRNNNNGPSAEQVGMSTRFKSTINSRAESAPPTTTEPTNEHHPNGAQQ